MYQELENELYKILQAEQVKADEPMKFHTTFRIGGPAQFYVLPQSEQQLTDVVKLCSRLQAPFFIVGNGSNLLVGDQGIEGVVIEIKDQFSYCRVEERGDFATVTAGAGILLSKLAKAVANHALTGFEFAAGIPGTLGGAVAMNAGAYGGEIKDHIIRAKVLTRDGEMLVLDKEELELGYRKSVVTITGHIVLEAEFLFPYGEKETILETIKELNGRRKEKQPLEYPSAGSTFKRPEGYFAGKLIMDAGLRGFRIGNIMVSEKHCGFVVNAGNGTAAEVRELIDKVSGIVEEKFGVKLEPEVRFLGRF